MRRLLLLLPFCILPALAQDAPAIPPAPAAAPATTLSALTAALAPLETDPIFQSSVAGVQVVRVDTGEIVYSYGDDQPLIPASTMKVVTAATALRTLGPTWRFPTWILYDGELDGGVLKGNLYIKGQGDPTMVIERMWRMVRDLKLRGINEVKGDIIFDDSYFADTTLLPGWNKQEDIEAGPTYFAPLGALSLNYNIATIVIRPGAGSGQAAIAEFDTPTPAVVIDNQLVTGSRNSRMRLDVERAVDPETGKITTFTLKGTVPAEAEPERVYRTLTDPLGNYIGGFDNMLKAHDIKVKGRLYAGTTSKKAELLLRFDSETLAEVLGEMNKQSNNFMAEQILRSVGAEAKGLPGTTQKGVEVIQDYLAQIGISATEYRLVNGSGLSREIGLRPSQINKVLVDMWHNVAVGPEFLTTLAVGGRDGTLRSRFRDDDLLGRVRGKTGTLSGVHCLAGYVYAVDHQVYAFSFMVNEVEGALSRVRKAHDRLVSTLAGTAGNVVDGAESAESEVRLE